MTKAMTRDDIARRLIQLAAERGGVPVDQVTRETHLENDLGFDSLEDVEYAMEIEDEFDIRIEDAEVENLRTIGQNIDRVIQAVEEGDSPPK